MRVISIVAEYNPFHNGHEYQIMMAKSLFKADYVVVLMTGNYNQRGLPGIISKDIRADFAIKSGADLVIEIPVCYSLEDTPIFIYASIAIMNNLGIVDNVLFGSETGNIQVLKNMASIFSSLKFKNTYGSLDESMSPSERRSMSFDMLGLSDYSKIINKPNNLIAVYIIDALSKLNSMIEPITIMRKGSEYFDTELSTGDSQKFYSSATAIREIIQKNINDHYPREIISSVPDYVSAILGHEWKKSFPLMQEDFYKPLIREIRNSTIEELSSISGISIELALSLKMCEAKKTYKSISDCIKSLYKYLNIDRRLFRIITRQKKADVLNYLANDPIYTLNILGCSSRGEMLKKRIIENRLKNTYHEQLRNPKFPIFLQKQSENGKYADLVYATVIKRKYGGFHG